MSVVGFPPHTALSRAVCCALGVVVMCAPATGREADTALLGEGDLLLGVPGDGPLTREQAEAWVAEPRNHRVVSPVLPLGLAAATIDAQGLEANPLTRAKIELGRQLFFDKRLSVDGTVSCASCHSPDHGFASPDRVGRGVRDQAGDRNSPTAANRLLSAAQFWDGRVASLEEQALGPISNPIEMGSSHAAVVALCREIGAYRTQFEASFEDGVTIENVAKAIASFERALVSGPTPWDIDNRLSLLNQSIADGDDDPDLIAERDRLASAARSRPLSPAARRGGELFFSDRAGCTLCHAGANFTDERFHNLGVGATAETGAIDSGRYAVSGADEDRGAFKTPSLRNVAQTAPYMHDGSIDTLEEVVAWYADGGRDNPHLSPLVQPLDLTADEQADLVAFLRSLTGEWPEVATGRLPE